MGCEKGSHYVRVFISVRGLKTPGAKVYLVSSPPHQLLLGIACLSILVPLQQVIAPGLGGCPNLDIQSVFVPATFGFCALLSCLNITSYLPTCVYLHVCKCTLSLCDWIISAACGLGTCNFKPLMVSDLGYCTQRPGLDPYMFTLNPKP